MEKGNAKASSSKTNNPDPKTKQDVANKHLRLPRVKDSGSPRPDNRRKSNPQKNQEHFDKRPRNRTNASYGRYRNEIADGAVGEPYSKQAFKKTSLNHLLNFTLAKNEDHWELNSRRSTFNRPKLPKYNKELFLQANCQFIARSNGDYKVHEKNPDILVEWSLIEEIRLPCHEVPLCPICLYVPVAAKITRCGHIYCWPCMLHYLALTDKSWQKCPICFEAVHKADLKSVSLHVRKCFTVGDEISMCLMKREKGTLLVTRVTHEKTPQSICSIDNEDSMTRYHKLLLGNQREVQSILNRERNELEEAYEKEKDTPECCFIESALKLLHEREINLNQSMINGQHSDLNSGLTEKNMNMSRRRYLTSTSSVDSNEGSLNSEINQNMMKFGNSPDSNSTMPNLSSEADNKSMRFFYQAEDGQHIYLHNINVRMLINEYGSLENAPHVITAKLVEIERDSITEGLRKRLRYLQHLPLTCEFQVVELDFNKQISKSTLQQFESEIKKRRINRNRKASNERKREQMIRREENKKLGLYPKANYNLNSIDQFPAYHPEDFMDHLPPNSDNKIERPICDEDVSNSNASPDYSFPSNYSEEVESSSPPATSFAQMLKDGSKTFVSPPKEIKPVSYPTCEPQSDVDSDGDNYVPVYNQSFSDAIQAALDSVTLQDPSDNATSSKKKKKGKKQLLFTTSMCRRNN